MNVHFINTNVVGYNVSFTSLISPLPVTTATAMDATGISNNGLTCVPYQCHLMIFCKFETLHDAKWEKGIWIWKLSRKSTARGNDQTGRHFSCLQILQENTKCCRCARHKGMRRSGGRAPSITCRFVSFTVRPPYRCKKSLR